MFKKRKDKKNVKAKRHNSLAGTHRAKLVKMNSDLKKLKLDSYSKKGKKAIKEKSKEIKKTVELSKTKEVK